MVTKTINHKKMPLKERAKLLVRYHNSRLHKNKPNKDEFWKVQDLLDGNWNKEHVAYYRLHFDEYVCKRCNKPFEHMFEISEDWGMPVCMVNTVGRSQQE